ncbi:hypothetical protein C8R47DRAFT_1327571 [Mycena vitilis]|nr:hypothetical protein C8R47DRAFT_1327571 [Mycena vitilis]
MMSHPLAARSWSIVANRSCQPLAHFVYIKGGWTRSVASVLLSRLPPAPPAKNTPARILQQAPMSPHSARMGAKNPGLVMASLSQTGDADFKVPVAHPRLLALVKSKPPSKSTSFRRFFAIKAKVANNHDDTSAVPPVTPPARKMEARPNAPERRPFVVPFHRPDASPRPPRPILTKSRPAASRRSADASLRTATPPAVTKAPAPAPATRILRRTRAFSRSPPAASGTSATTALPVAPVPIAAVRAKAVSRSPTSDARSSAPSRIPLATWRRGHQGRVKKASSDTKVCPRYGCVLKPNRPARAPQETAPKPAVAASRTSVGTQADVPEQQVTAVPDTLPIPPAPTRISSGTQTDAAAPAMHTVEAAPAPSAVDTAPTPDAAHLKAMAAINSMIKGNPRLKATAVFKRVRAAQGADTNEDLLGELKSRIATPSRTPLAPRSAEAASSAPSPSPAVLRPRPRARGPSNKENDSADPASELQLAFARFGRDRNLPLAVTDSGTDAPHPLGFCRPPLASPLVHTGVDHRSTVATLPNPVKIHQRVVVPDLDDGARASRDPRILLELDALRSQGRVGGGRTGDQPERAMSLVGLGILRKNRKEQKNMSSSSVAGTLPPATFV